MPYPPYPPPATFPAPTGSDSLPAGHPFLNADFLAILERHGTAGPACGWQAHHLVARDGNGKTLGILPLYVRANSHGDFIHDWSWAAAYQQLGKPYFPKLLSGLPHTPAAGPRFLVGPGSDADAVRHGLIETALRVSGGATAVVVACRLPGRS